MAKAYFFPLALCFAFILPLSLATIHGFQDQPRFRYRGDCMIENLNSLGPTRRLESEAGYTELWDEEEQMFDCAGVAPVRHTIRPRGLLLPSYSNSPRFIYIVEGEGIGGVVIPGCPETFRSFQQYESERGQGSRRFGRESERGHGSNRPSSESEMHQGDEHQKLHQIRQGDIIALPAGVSAWTYNTGDRPMIAVTMLDTGNHQNQLDRNSRRFFLAGTVPQQSEMESSRGHQQEGRSRKSRSSEMESWNNIFSGFDTRMIAEALGIDESTASSIQNPDQSRGFIIQVDNLQVSWPRRGDQHEVGSERGRHSRWNDEDNESYAENGVSEPICHMKLHQNIDKPSRSDIYSRDGGHLTTLNSAKLPILSYLQFSAERGHLRRNAIMAPHWNMNAHSVVYAIRGSARMQIVDNTGNAVFDGTINEGEIVVIPQNYAVVKQAEKGELEWVSFKTSEFAMTSPLAGKTSVFRGLPEDVLANAFGISREEAMRVKYGREMESMMLGPMSSSSEGRRASA